ncbi:MAG: hypothetical protein ABI690_35740 [Chloroflexota bacterium]
MTVKPGDEYVSAAIMGRCIRGDNFAYFPPKMGAKGGRRRQSREVSAD